MCSAERTERFDVLSDFLHDNGFTPIYDPGQEQARAEYEHRIAALTFPLPARPTWQQDPPRRRRARRGQPRAERALRVPTRLRDALGRGRSRR